MATHFLLTNVVNAARIISFGMVGPPAVLGHRYVDDGRSHEGSALLLHPELPPAPSVEGMPTPVVVEIEDDRLPEPSTAAASVLGVVPAAAVVRLHFANEDALREFVTTPYSNVDPTRFEAVVGDLRTPDDSEPSASSAAVPTLLDDMGTDAGPEGLAAVVREVDRLLGGLAELLSAPGIDAEALDRLCSVVKTAVATPRLDAVAAVLDDSPVAELSVRMVERDPDDRQTRQALDGIDGLDEHVLAAATRVLRGRADLEGPDSIGDDVVWAFVVALMRESPETLAANVGPEVPARAAQLAAWFAGLRRGHARRPTSSRRPVVESFLEALGANRLNEAIGGLDALGLPEPRRTIERRDGAWDYVLELDGAVLVGRRDSRGLPSRLGELDGILLAAAAELLDVPFGLGITTGPGAAVTVAHSDEALVLDVPAGIGVRILVDRDEIGAAAGSAGSEVVARLEALLPVEVAP